MIRTGLTLFAALAVTGCAPTTDTAVGDGAPVQVQEIRGEAVDVHFEPLALRSGERVTVEADDVRMTSTATPSGHDVRLVSPRRAVQRVVGLLDGRTQHALTAEGHGADGGVTSAGPTSVHRYTACQAGRCGEIIEYDYDLHDPTGDGTAEWRAPDGRSATIDRLRFEIAANAGTRSDGGVRVITPEPLAVAAIRTR